MDAHTIQQHIYLPGIKRTNGRLHTISTTAGEGYLGQAAQDIFQRGGIISFIKIYQLLLRPGLLIRQQHFIKVDDAQAILNVAILCLSLCTKQQYQAGNNYFSHKKEVQKSKNDGHALR